VKTKKLIELLQEADPSGELECVIGCDDVFDVTEMESYWDGTPALLVRDPTRDGYYDVTGLFLPGSGAPNKIRIDALSATSALLTQPDLTVTYGNEDARHYNEGRIETLRAECRSVIAETDAWRAAGRPPAARPSGRGWVDALRMSAFYVTLFCNGGNGGCYFTREEIHRLTVRLRTIVIDEREPERFIEWDDPSATGESSAPVARRVTFRTKRPLTDEELDRLIAPLETG